MKHVAPITENLDIATRKFVLDNAGGTVTSVNNVAPVSGNVTLSATNIAITDTNNNFTTDTVQGAIDQLFQSANSGKTAIANAIGTPITSTNTFGEMATAITDAKTALDTFVDKAEGTTTGSESLSQLTTKLNDVRVFKQNTKLRQQASTTHTITLNKSVSENMLCFTVNRLVNDNTTTEFTSTFDGTDASSFYYNTNAVEFANGRMRLRELTVTNTTPTTTVVSSGTIRSWTVDVNDYNVFPAFQIQDFRVTGVSGNTLTYQILSRVQFINTQIGMSIFIDVSDTSSLESATITNVLSGQGDVKIVVRVEGDTHWKAWNGTSWINVSSINPQDNFSILQNGMSKATLEALTYLQFEQLLGTKTKLAFGFALYREKFSDVAEIDSFSLSGRAIGNFIPIPASGNQPYTMSYNQPTKQMTFTFTQEDTYQINWIDT